MVLEVAGGQSPQHLVNEFAREIAEGRTDAVLLVGAEAISTARHLAGQEEKPDWNEDPAGEVEDRGLGLRGLITRHMLLHGLADAPTQYSLLENARRARTGQTREEYAAAMGALFAPFTEVAARNPHSFAPDVRSAAELVTVDERNRRITDAYPRFLVAREMVNQAAAVVLTSLGRARELGIDEEKLVFLHGQCDLREPDVFARPELEHAPTAARAVSHALELAEAELDDIAAFDLYSCFPVAVAHLCDQLGLAPDDPRGLTLTGGLPFFGGAGNNYSMHAIAEAVARARAEPGSLALVLANGGILTKCSVGVYGASPVPRRNDRSVALQREVDAEPQVANALEADGWATLETWALQYQKSGQRGSGIVVGRLDADGRRFLASVEKGDDPMLDLLEHEDQPAGTRVFVRSFGFGNRVTVSEQRMDELFPPRAPGFQDDYEHLLVRRDAHLLEITLNRPDSRNALHPPAHEELDQVLDAYLADADLWVAIITGAGEAFCSGSDLLYGLSGNPVYLPKNGFGGLTSRGHLPKPVIAAVNGPATDGGFELALACHLVVADENAEFALGEVRIGMLAGAGGLVRLPRAIPAKVANELILTGRAMGADEARGLGLVNRVAGAGKALEAARELAATILEGSPTSVRTALVVMEETRGVADTVEAVKQPSDALDDLLFSQDALEGMTAFAEGRAPQWKNL